MTSIAITREASDPTAAGPTAAHEPVTGRTPNAWSVGIGDQSQPETFRALAWSQCDDSLADPLPYSGDDYSVSELDSRQTARTGDAAEPAPEPRYRRSALLFGIAAGFATAAIGALVLTVINTDGVPATTSPVVIQPAQNASIPQPNGATARQNDVVRSAPSTQTAPKTAGAPSRSVPPAVNTTRTGGDTPAPAAAALAPAASPPAEAATSEVTAPEATAPEVTAPQVAAPQAAAPDVAGPENTPVVHIPPGIKPPVVYLPEVTPQQVPHPVGPTVFHVPTEPAGPLAPIPNPPGSVPPVIQWPAAPAAPEQGGTFNPVLTLTPIIPTFTLGSGQSAGRAGAN